jgi:uncharacterized protein YndB with AHSA1/START domain
LSYDLRLERLYDAAPEVVFDAFTNPDAQKELYADAPDWVVGWRFLTSQRHGRSPGRQ